MPTLDAIEEKWYRKAIAGFRKAWVQMVQRSESFDAFVEGVSAVSGIPAETVRASIPAQNWKDFQANASKYLEIAVAKLEAAHRTGKWKVKYRRAFGG